MLLPRAVGGFAWRWWRFGWARRDYDLITGWEHVALRLWCQKVS